MKYFLLLLFSVTLLLSCDENDFPTFQEQLDEDVAIIEEYLSNNGITAIKDVSGVFYTIEEEGTGDDFPTVNSEVSMAYTGMFLDGTIFDSADTVNPLNARLSGLINGWQIGVPKFKKGGKGTLYIPSGYAYGRFGRGGIPGNSILIFEIELLNFE